MEDINKLSFDEAMTKLEEKIKELENDNGEDSDKIYQQALQLKEYCAKILREEREEIIKIAKENGVELSEIGLDEDDDDFDEDDFDDEDEEDSKKS